MCTFQIAELLAPAVLLFSTKTPSRKTVGWSDASNLLETLKVAAETL
jgi:hypothetical protein